MTLPQDIAALLGSRICHDLVSPIGAISNGVELLQMSGLSDGPEVELISESVENANARIRFFRIAFGVASAEQVVGAKEIRDIMRDLTQGSRLTFNWDSSSDHSRPDVKLAFLMLQCMESAMPWGGQVTVERDAAQWVITGTTDRMKINQDHWDALQYGHSSAEIGAAEVQFLLFPILAAEIGRAAKVSIEENAITVRF